MKILITGRGTSGSWEIRGKQLGAAVGATVAARAQDVAPFDLAVAVKRVDSDTVDCIHRARVPLVWDIVDAWPQPLGNTWGRAQCMTWLRNEIRRIRPAGIVAATKAMARDCVEFGVPVLALPHHARPGLARNPVRGVVRTVGYEGAEHYLGKWRRVLEIECTKRDWRFVVNPCTYSDLDIVVALRDADGYAARHWKSAVKLANAQGSGTPFIGCRESGYLEQAVGAAERWADTKDELARAFDVLTPLTARQTAADWMHSVAPRLPDVAARYRYWLEELACKTAGKS